MYHEARRFEDFQAEAVSRCGCASRRSERPLSSPDAGNFAARFEARVGLSVSGEIHSVAMSALSVRVFRFGRILPADRPRSCTATRGDPCLAISERGDRFAVRRRALLGDGPHANRIRGGS